MEKPKQLPNPDFSELIKLCQEHLDFFESDEFHGDYLDDEYADIYDAVMTTIFGEDVADWTNDQWE